MTITAILTAAGSGTRLGADVPKALVPINGIPMVRIAADNLRRSGVVDELIVTVPAGELDQFTTALADLPLPVTFVIGGETRQSSIEAALGRLGPGVTKVLVHDAARPFAPSSLIAAVAQAVTEATPAVIPAVPVTDTIKRVAVAAGDSAPNANLELVTGTLERDRLRAVQTPQGFSRQVLQQAYQLALASGLTATDDAGLVEALGVPVAVIPGTAAALKITTPTDLLVASLLYAGD